MEGAGAADIRQHAGGAVALGPDGAAGDVDGDGPGADARDMEAVGARAGRGDRAAGHVDRESAGAAMQRENGVGVGALRRDRGAVRDGNGHRAGAPRRGRDAARDANHLRAVRGVNAVRVGALRGDGAAIDGHRDVALGAAMLGEDAVGFIARGLGSGAARQGDGDIALVLVLGVNGVGGAAPFLRDVAVFVDDGDAPSRDDGAARDVDDDIADAGSRDEIVAKAVAAGAGAGLLDQAVNAAGVSALGSDGRVLELDDDSAVADLAEDARAVGGVTPAIAPVHPLDAVGVLAQRGDPCAIDLDGDPAPARRDDGGSSLPDGKRLAGVQRVDAGRVDAPRHDDAVGRADADVAVPLVRRVDAAGLKAGGVAAVPVQVVDLLLEAGFALGLGGLVLAPVRVHRQGRIQRPEVTPVPDDGGGHTVARRAGIGDQHELPGVRVAGVVIRVPGDSQEFPGVRVAGVVIRVPDGKNEG